MPISQYFRQHRTALLGSWRIHMAMLHQMRHLSSNDRKRTNFHEQPAVIVIEVEEYNTDSEFQLFYAPDGKLLQTLNVSDTGGEIYPGLF